MKSQGYMFRHGMKYDAKDSNPFLYLLRATMLAIFVVLENLLRYLHLHCKKKNMSEYSNVIVCQIREKTQQKGQRKGQINDSVYDVNSR